MNQHQGKYSILIQPINLVLDIIVVLIGAAVFTKGVQYPNIYLGFITLSWIVLSYFLDFYTVYRYTKLVTIIKKIFYQFFIYTLLILSYFSLIKDKAFSRLSIFHFLLFTFIIVFIIKIGLFYLLKNYRLKGKNYRKVIVLGDTNQTARLIKIFDEKPYYGYHFKGFFTNKDSEKSIGSLNDYIDYVKEHEISEIYCSIAELTDDEIKKAIDFGDDNFIKIKFIPDDKAILKKNLNVDYYENFPILSLRKISLEEPHNKFLKRLFDVVFSSFVIITVLSWLTPLMYFLIKRESKGPLFFKQKRNGLGNKEFECYKFRSMTVNDRADTDQVKKGDLRITNIGRIIRKTSIDELPQFFNVLKGNMSVVGPRPHMVNETNKFTKKIDKFLLRHLVKPGITGLAQVKGCRGEIETDNDIQNRYRYDIMYIEMWSFILDLKIIIQTVINAIKGEEKAY